MLGYALNEDVSQTVRNSQGCQICLFPATFGKDNWLVFGLFWGVVCLSSLTIPGNTHSSLSLLLTSSMR